MIKLPEGMYVLFEVSGEIDSNLCSGVEMYLSKFNTTTRDNLRGILKIFAGI